MDNEFLESDKAQQSTNGLEIALLAIARSLNNIAESLGEEEEDERYFIRDMD